ncbi:MAG: NAD(+)/NADH kinase [Methanobacteriota archaeon]|nr:MAG: NAD(+)/NADH kinase [Euryarchaeota archaeon]
MRIGVVGTPDLSKFKSVANDVLKALDGQESVLEEETAAALGREGVPLSGMDEVDVVISIGGDGTVLRTVKSTEKPILGINAGAMGFLTEVNPDGIEDAIGRLLEGDYTIDERTKLRTVMDGQRLQDAMNEAVIHTAQIAKMRHFSVSIDGQPATDLRADGVIVATPTGSTCYAMSVGSSIVDPRVEALVIAPIAPFRLAARPFVVPATSEIDITIAEPMECTMVIDGQEVLEMTGSERLEFSASEKKGRFISLEDDFYRDLQEKLIAFTPQAVHRH